MEKVLEHSSLLGNAPRPIGGDFNAPLGDLLNVPRSLAMALINRRLVDVDRELAEAEAHPCLCHPTVKDRRALGRRPDRLLCGAGACALPGDSFLGYCPVACELRILRAS